MENFRRVQAKLAGRFSLVRKDDEELVVHCFGALGQLGVTQEDVEFICNFYMVEPTETWLRERAKDAGDSFYIIVKRS